MTPDELARASADAMWSADTASRGLGMELVDVSPGRATVAMTLSDAMLNGHEIAHGGYIFTLADSAFAFACNSYGERTVAVHCSISFIKPAARGDRLIATAREVSRVGRSGIYDVSVTVNGTVIAEFRGHSRTIGGSIV
ncbi:MAG TPA: hydroxyphenylacetyl-CoA thioesterase PaaI [Gemmatimonadaceae bacterium]|nr:hydroxyphenylacetyl-CoA thioesterase PaaI [Gemmatimonadaceae bacterium]